MTALERSWAMIDFRLASRRFDLDKSRRAQEARLNCRVDGQDLDILLRSVRFCNLGFIRTSTMAQKESFARHGHWALVMHGLDDSGKHRLGVVCGSQCRFHRQMSTASGPPELKICPFLFWIMDEAPAVWVRV